MRGIYKSLLVVVAVVVAGFATTPISNAQVEEGAVSLAVSPQSIDVTANPGETLENTFRLTNASPDQVDIVTTPKNFVPLGEEGAVDLTVDDTGFSLAEWVTVSPDTAQISPGATQDFNVTIAVPENAEPGSHFGSVVFQTIPPEQEGSAALVSQEIAPVILVKVAGDVTESAEIVEFRAEESFYSTQDEYNLFSRIENDGTVHFKPAGNIIIKNMWGNEVATIDLERRNVLPDSIRQITTTWQPEGLQLGRYSATLTLVLDNGSEIKTAETSFFVFPYQTIVPIVVVIGLLVFVAIRYHGRFVKAAKVLTASENNQEKPKE